MYIQKTLLLLTGLIFIISFNLSAQRLQDSLLNYFTLLQNTPQEKLYLHLDKPFYGAGDTIWFKAYLQNAVSYKSDAKSNYFILELINREDSIMERRKVRRDSLGLRGSIPLPPDIQQGEYYIRGYSN
ncbi:MAG: hypothetical protein LUD15_08690 [Bacteroides sp.]|nr:hypothetical protein [Bacteroides sp.]